MAGPIAQHLTWMRLRNLRPATIDQRRLALRRLQRALPVPLLEATREDLRAWQEGLTLSGISMACEVTNVACFYRWAVEDAELLAVNPAVRLTRPKPTRHLPRPIAEERLALGIACAEPDVRFMLILASCCGLRAGELARLQRSDLLDARDPAIVMVDGKGGKPRVTPMSSLVCMELTMYGPPLRGAVFPRHDGKPGGMTAGRLSQLVNNYLHGMGIPDTLHSLRHRFGTKFNATDPDLRLLMEIMGHSSTSTLLGYVAFNSVKAAAVVEQMPAPGRQHEESRPTRPEG